MEWNACTQEPSAWLRWVECHVAFGSYLQAIGVVAAVFGSAWITRAATRASLKPVLDERAGRARTIVYRLLPPVNRIAATTVRIKKVYEQTEGGMMLAASGRLEDAVYYLRIDTVLPGDVLDGLQVLSQETAETVAQLYYYLDQYNDFIDRNVPLLRSLDGAGRAEFDQTYKDLFDAVEMLAKKAADQLQNARQSSP
jgi:hypothetical protein